MEFKFLALPYRIERHMVWKMETIIYILFIYNLITENTKRIAVLILSVQNNYEYNANYAYVKYGAGGTDAWKLQLLNIAIQQLL